MTSRLCIDKTLQERFDKAVELYREWNGKINVISRKDSDYIWSHHFRHSLSIAEFIDFATGETVLDLGTGGGFPGVPLAILRPDVHFVLCDSIGKKTLVATEVARALGLDNVDVVRSRVEDLPGRWDWVVTRAVADLSVLYPWVRGRYGRGLVCLKGGDVASEISAFVRKFRVNPSCIHVRPVSDVYDEEYFREKFVIHIEKI